MISIILTGTPGTGKSMISDLLEKKFKNCKVLRLNDLINNEKIWTKKENNSKVVNLTLLKKSVINKIRILKKSNFSLLIIEGHLACELKLPVDAVIVLRTNPKIILKRLKRRDYPKEKISENIQSEILDYCTQRSESNFNDKVYELDSSGSLNSTFSKVVKLISLIENLSKNKNSSKSLSYKLKLNKFKPKISWSKYFADKQLFQYLFD